jgi:hypothetical protein
MLDLLLQVFGLVLLLVGVWLGYQRWIRPREAALDSQGRGLLLLVVLTLMGGFIGSPFWWVDEERSFAWDLLAPVSRILAAAGWSFVVVCFLALRRPSRRRLRLVLYLLVTYLGPLALVIVLFHPDRLDFSAPITYAFLLIAVGMLLTTIRYLLRQPAIIADEPRDTAPSSPMIRGWLGFIAILAGLWGLALFITDGGAFMPAGVSSSYDPYSPGAPASGSGGGLAGYVWAWPGDLLTSRLIAVMLLAIAVGAATSLRYADVSQVMLGTTLAYGLGVALAGLWNALAGQPIILSYFVVFGLMFLGSAILLLLDRSAALRSPAVTST